MRKLKDAKSERALMLRRILATLRKKDVGLVRVAISLQRRSVRDLKSYRSVFSSLTNSMCVFIETGAITVANFPRDSTLLSDYSVDRYNYLLPIRPHPTGSPCVSFPIILPETRMYYSYHAFLV